MAVFEVSVIQPKKPAKPGKRRRFECKATCQIQMIQYECTNGRWCTYARNTRTAWEKHLDWPLDYPAWT